MNTTLEDLQAALEKTGNQCITIYRSGASRLIGPRWSAPTFQSLPELSEFVAEINGRPSALATLQAQLAIAKTVEKEFLALEKQIAGVQAASNPS